VGVGGAAGGFGGGGVCGGFGFGGASGMFGPSPAARRSAFMVAPADARRHGESARLAVSSGWFRVRALSHWQGTRPALL
jgi:hypothetical protein